MPKGPEKCDPAGGHTRGQVPLPLKPSGAGAACFTHTPQIPWSARSPGHLHTMVLHPAVNSDPSAWASPACTGRCPPGALHHR